MFFNLFLIFLGRHRKGEMVLAICYKMNHPGEILNDSKDVGSSCRQLFLFTCFREVLCELN